MAEETVQEAALKAGKSLARPNPPGLDNEGRKTYETKRGDQAGPTHADLKSRGDDVLTWNPELSGQEFISDGAMFFCGRLDREDEYESDGS